MLYCCASNRHAMLVVIRNLAILTLAGACPNTCSTCSRVRLGCGPSVVAETNRTSLMIASRGEPAIYSIGFFGRRRQYIIVALNLEDAGPWYSLFIAMDCHEHFPLPPINVSDQSDACVRARIHHAPKTRERVPLLCCSHFLEMKGSAQDALKGCLSPRRSN